ncbi:MAG: 3-hydroxyacyl-ACP dehydratase FabZ [Elusimicrobiales bacterium]|nr:3-hydroxyacyl-ACP dehydratase FabZ [Elusimicrobiales bacterium]
MSETENKNLEFLLAATPVRIMKITDILAAIPHRPPFLLVDRVEIVVERKYGVGVKCVTVNEPFFQGHFPGNPIMPGVLMLEAMAQTCASMVMSLEQFRGRNAFFLAIDNAKFRQMVIPGDVLKMAVEITRLAKAGRAHGEVYAGGKLAAEADMTFILSEGDAR